MFKCIICGNQSEPGERANKVTLQSKVVYQDKEGVIRASEYSEGLNEGKQIIKEGLAHKMCLSKEVFTVVSTW